MSFGGSAPRPVDPTASSNTQLGFNQQAAEAQQALNMINQQTPYASMNWLADPNAPGGYSANYQLTPEQQQLLANQQQIQRQAGGIAGQLGGQLGGMAGQLGSLYGGPPPNFADPNAITSQLMRWQQAYVQPIFGQQQSNLDAQLQNQGLAPGSVAYNNAQNLLARNQGDVNTNFLMQAQPLGFQQTMASYMNPLNVYNQLGNMYGSAQRMAGGPTAPGWINPPQETVAPPNYQQAAQAEFDAKQKQYQQQQQGMGQLLGAGASLALAPFTGGASLMMLPGTLAGTGGGGGGGGMSSMFSSPFSGGWGGSGYGGVTPQFGVS